MRSLLRTVYGIARQPSIGVPFSATVTDSPSPGSYWLVQHLSVELANYSSGLVTATLTVGGRYVASTNQGQHDSFDAGKTTVRVNPSELLVVTWNPTRVVSLVQGKIIATVEQYDR